MDALAITESDGSGRNGLTLTDATTTASVNATITAIPGMDDNNITVATGTAAEFAPTANTTYAYVYDTQTWNGIKVVLTGDDAPTDWVASDANVYYSDAACTTKVTTAYPAGGGTYYKRESYIYTAKVVESGDATDWTTKWYKDPDGKEPVGAWETDNVGKTFYKKYTVNGKLYGVKVIKVVSGS